MKKRNVICLMILALLVAGQLGWAQDKKKARKGPRPGNAEQRALQEKLKDLSPQERMMARLKHTHQADLAAWKKVRAVAAEEKATKTLAVIDEIIAEKEAQMQKKMAAWEKRQAGMKDKTPKPDGPKKRGAKKERKKAK